MRTFCDIIYDTFFNNSLSRYYVLRKDLLRPFVDELQQELANHEARKQGGWEVNVSSVLLLRYLLMETQNVDAILHCIMSVQEAVEISENEYLNKLFSSQILGRLPKTGHDRVQRTTLGLIG